MTCFLSDSESLLFEIHHSLHACHNTSVVVEMSSTKDPNILALLKERYAAGLQSYSSSANQRTVTNLATETGLPESKIKQWINNQNRSNKEERASKMNMKEVGKKWKKIKQDPVRVAEYKAQNVEHHEKFERNLTKKQKSNSAASLIREISKKCESLYELGYQSICVATNSTDVMKCGSKLGLANGAKVEEIMLQGIFGGAGPSRKAMNREELRKKVSNMFVDKYCAGTG